MIAIDYGMHHTVKKMKYFEMREKEMISYFENKPENFFFPHFNKEFTFDVEILSYHSKLKYLLNTPSSLLFLIEKKVISLETALKIFSTLFLFFPAYDFWQKDWFFYVSRLWKEEKYQNQKNVKKKKKKIILQI